MKALLPVMGIMLSINTGMNAQGYCPPTISCTSAAITSVSLNGTTNTSGTVGGYTSYSSPTYTVSQAGGYTLTVNGNIGFAGTYILNAWIDYDGSGDWNGVISENIEIAPPQGYALGNFTKSVSFAVPATATVGASRMRIQLRFIVGGGAANACQTGFCGEVEDYPVNITALPPLCSSASNNSSGIYISKTDINGTTTFSGPSTSSSFSPNPIITLFPQTTYFASVDVTNPTNTPQNVYVYGWLDADGNHVMSTGGNEQIVLTASPVTVPALGSITVVKPFSFSSPFAAQATTLRFNASLASHGIPTPCETSFTGEVENYTVLLHSDYCTNSADPSSVGISSISFNGTSYPISCCSNYYDYTSTVIPISPGQSYSFSAVTYGGATVAAVYVDYNQNGIFSDAGEKVTLSGSGTFSGTVSVPALATVGNTRMRVVSIFTVGGGLPADCNLNGVFGAVADYTVSTIAPGPPTISCSGNVTVPQEPGVCSAHVVYSTPVCTANCNGGTISLISGLPSGSVFPLGTTQVHYRLTTLGGTDDCFFDVTVTMSPTPAITPASSAICQGSSISLNSFSSYQWNTGATSQSIIPSASGTYTATVTNSSGCTGTVSKTVTLNPLPTPAISGSNNICAGSSTSLSAGSFAGYSWSTGQTSPSISVNSAGNYTVTVSDGNGCTGTSAPFTVNVNAVSTAPSSINGTSSVCAGGQVTLSQVGGSLGTGASYQWYSGTCGGTPEGSGASITVSPTVTTTYFVRAEGSCNTTACASFTVTVNTPSEAPASITGNSIVCNGGLTTLTQSDGLLGTGADYEWFSGTCGGTPEGTGPALTIAAPVTTTYFVRAAGTCNTTACASITVTVNTLSSTPVSVSGVTNICAGSSTALTQLGGILGTGADYQWYSGSCGGVAEGNGATLNVSPTVTTTYFVRAEGTCNTTSCASVTVTVTNTAATPVSATSDAPFNNICLGNSVNLTVNGGALGAGVDWKWYSGSCGGVPVGTGTTVHVTPTTNTTYYVRSEGGCVNSSCVSVTVTVNTTPVTSLALMPFAGMPGSVCNGTVATLSIAAVNKASFYVWDAPAGSYFNGNPLNVSPFSTATPVVTVTFGSPAGSLYNVGVQAGNACGVSTRQSQKVRGLTSVPASISGSLTACANSNGSYSTPAVDGATSYLWTITGNATVTGTGNTVTVTFGPGWTSGTLCVSAQTACYTSASRCIAITKNASPLNAISGIFTACPNSVIVYSVPSGTGVATYNWTTPPGGSGSSTSSSITVTYGAGYSATGNICVSTTSICGITSAVKCKTVAPGLPARPASIAGALSGLCGQSLAYSCPAQGAGTSYNWTAPSGATINGNGNSSVNMAFGTFTTGSICVTASNNCGSGLSRCVSVKGAPNSPSAITANPASWCANTAGIQFSTSTAGITGNYSLNWLYPSQPVATYILGGGNSSSLVLDWGTGNGNVVVVASNACGSGSKSFSGIVNCREGEISSEKESVLIYPNPSNGMITVQFTATNSFAKIYLQDLSGRVVMTENVNTSEHNFSRQMDVRNLAKGTYILYVQNADDTRQAKLLIE